MEMVDRFEVISNQIFSKPRHGVMFIFKDKITGVLYVQSTLGQGGLTLLVDIDGKPLVDKSE